MSGEPEVTKSPTTQDLEAWLGLARDISPRSRQRLADNVTDLFLAEDARLTERERNLILEILHKLIREVEADVRRDLAEQLSRTESVPRELIVELANDDIDIARPILLRSDVLHDPDLIEVVRNRTRDHRLAVALRDGLSEDVTDTLVRHGDEDVLVAMLRNQDARLSRFASEYLVAESEQTDAFQEPLLRRADLPPDLAMRMYWWVSAALRRHILLRYPVDALIVDEFIEDSTAHALDNRNRDGGATADSARKLIERMRERRELTPRFMIHALRAGRVSVFSHALAAWCDVSELMARRIIFDGGVESLAVVCKATGISRQDFELLFLLTRSVAEGRVARSPAAIESSLSLFDRLEEEKAIRVLRLWRRRPEYESALQRVPGDKNGYASA